MNVLVWILGGIAAAASICALNGFLKGHLRSNRIWVITCPRTATLALVEVKRPNAARGIRLRSGLRVCDCSIVPDYLYCAQSCLLQIAAQESDPLITASHR